jgi:hypothetical protein
MSFLELEGLHVFVTGAAGGIGSAIVDEFLGMYNTSRDYNLIQDFCRTGFTAVWCLHWFITIKI